jgi:6-pyruvoyltetrahydropterin/6-carboxytetrahydropterin synthase
MYELTISEEFEAAHRLPEYDGKCCRLHGHNWRVEVAVRGKELDASGLLIDFKILKAHVGEVLSTLDHYYLNELEAFASLPPSAEHIARYVYDMLSARPAFGDRVKVYAVKVWESPRSCAAYMPEI